MKLKKILFITFLLMAILTVSAVNASDTNTTHDTLTADENIDELEIESDDVIASDSGDSVLQDNDTSLAIKTNPEVTVDDTEGIEGENMDVKVNLPNDATGSVVLTVDGSNSNSAIIGGVASFSVSGLSAGQYTALVSYAGDERYIAYNNVFNITVVPDGTFKALQILINREDSLTLDKDYEGSGTEITISKPIALDGNGHTLDAKTLSRIFNIQYKNCSISNLNFINGASDYEGGSVYIEGFCRIDACNFKNSFSNKSGGSIYANGNPMISNSNFLNTTASQMGGAIYSNSDMCGISASNFINCSADSGGSIYVNGNDSQIQNSMFKDSSAMQGGAIYWQGKRGLVSGSLFEFCAADNGGAIKWTGSDGKVENSLFTNCTARDDGGAIWSNQTVIIGCNFTDNSASKGSAMYGCDYTNCTFEGNSNPQIYLDENQRKNIAISITVPPICLIGSNVSAMIEMNESITCSADVFVNDVVIATVSIIDGKGNVLIAPDTAGEYVIHVVFSGNDEFLATYSTTMFTVIKKNLVPTVSYNDKGFISVTLPDDISNEVIFTIDVIFENITKTTDIDVKKLPSGNYTYSINYDGDVYYDSVSISENLEITKSLPYFNITTDNICYGDNQTVIVVILNDLSNNVSFTLYNNNDVFDNLTFNETLFKDYEGLGVGNYIIKVNYTGDDRHYEYQQNRTFTVMPKINMTQKLVITNYGQIYMDLGSATGSVQIFIDNEYYDGQRISASKVDYNLPTDDLSLGSHEVTFKYVGNSFIEDIFTYWDENSKEFLPIKYTLEILPKETTGEIKSDKTVYLTATIYDDGGKVAYDAKGTVEFFVNGVKYAVVDIVNGIAKLDVSRFKNGNYIIEWKYSGDNKYNQTSGSSRFNFNYKLTANNLNIVYLSSKTYSVTLYSNDKPLNGITVTFLINNKVYGTAKTNSKGVASIVISKTPGNYKITSKALSVATTKTLKVSHVLSLKTVKVKKSAKKLVLTAVLSKVNGKYVKNKKVTFKFNGKKLTAKTNKKGVAKLTIKKSLLKKLKVGKKVKYQATYKKDTVKKTVKVKK